MSGTNTGYVKPPPRVIIIFFISLSVQFFLDPNNRYVGVTLYYTRMKMSDRGQNSGNLCKNEAMPQIVTLNYPQGSLTGEQTTLLTHPYSQTLVHGQGSMYVSIYR